MNRVLATKKIKAKAKELGFLHCGIARADSLDRESKILDDWLDKGFHGEMKYMENHFNKRTDPRELVPGSKSVISFSYNYFTNQNQKDEKAPKISMYAFGRDYHKVVKKKLKELLAYIQDEIGEVNGRCFVDSAPILEREWAKRSGLGWIGKNTMLIHPKAGSFFFLAEMILDLDLEYDHEMSDYCGTCTKCIDACPTGSISDEGYLMDGSKCISYLTIELKDSIPDEFVGKMDHWMFGCDICQQVCPWNRFSTPHQEPEFDPSEQLINKSAREWEELREDEFDEIFRGSAVKRTKFSGLKRNIEFLKKS